MEIVVWIVAALVLLGVGYGVGAARASAAARGEGDTRADARIRRIAESVARGRRPDGLAPGSAEAELQAALEQGWAPREQERLAALHEAVDRVSAFLDRAVRAPLAGADASADAAELRERARRALGALQDLEFFAGEVPVAREGRNLGALVQQVAREFATDQDVPLRLMIDDVPARADVNPSALMDALYLVLHNAARFGGGSTVDVSVTARDGGPRIVVRDRGQGFAEEAFARAFDPFYSTADDGLGLGLPHARRLIEGMGGSIELRNVPDGGAEVTLSFPVS